MIFSSHQNTRAKVVSNLNHVRMFKKNKNISDLRPNYRSKVLKMKMNKKLIRNNIPDYTKNMGANKFTNVSFSFSLSLIFIEL